MRLLRDHGPDPAGGTSWLSWPTGREVTTVCMHGLREVGATAASMVAELVPGAPPRAWVSMAPPCTGVFVPCWVDAGPPAVLAAAEGVATPASPWWRYRRLWEAVARSQDPGAAVDRIRAAWQPLEQQLAEHLARCGSDGALATRRDLSEQ